MEFIYQRAWIKTKELQIVNSEPRSSLYFKLNVVLFAQNYITARYGCSAK
jgi:hypothetical protein